MHLKMFKILVGYFSLVREHFVLNQFVVGGNGGSKSHIKWDFVGQNCVGYMWWCVGWF